MTNRLRTKVRLVKCPKCSEILPEPEQFPLYTCGGCGTILQAKYYRGENRASGLDSHVQVAAAQSNGLVQAHDGGESGSSSQRSCPAGGQSSSKIEAKDASAPEQVAAESNGLVHAHDGGESSSSSQRSSPASRQSSSTNEAEDQSAPEQVTAQSNGLVHAHDGRESSSSSQRSSAAGPGRQSSSKDEVKDQSGPEQAAAQSNCLGHAHDGRESSSSCQRSSPAGRQSSGKNEAKDQSAPEQVAAQTNGFIHAHDCGESGSSSQRSSPADGQSLSKNEVKYQSASEDRNSEQIGGANPPHFPLSSEELGFLENKGYGDIDDKPSKSDSMDRVVNQQEERPRPTHSASEASFTEVATVLENKEQSDGIAVQNHDQKCIGHVNSSKEASRIIDSQVLESKELLQSAPDHVVLENREAQQIARVNGVGEDEDDQHPHSHVISSDNQKQVGGVSSIRGASMLNECLDIDNKESWHLAGELETVCNGSNDHLLGENRKEPPESRLFHEKIQAEDNNHHDAENSPNLAKRDSNGKAADDSVDCMGEQLGSVKLSETALSAEITRVRNDSSTAGLEFSSEAYTDAGEMGSRNVSRDPHSGSGFLKNATENFRQKNVDFDDGSAYGSEIVGSANHQRASEPVSTLREDGRLLKVVSRSLTKGSLAYDGSVSSFDGNDGQVPDGRNPATKNVASREAYSISGFQNQAKNSSQMQLDEKLKRTMLEEEESVEENTIPIGNRIRPNRDSFVPRVPLYCSSELAYETGSSSSYAHEDELLSHRIHHHRYRYDDSEPWVRKTYPQKRNIDQRRFPEAAWRENEFVPMYYTYGTSGEIYHRSRHHGYVNRRRAENWSLNGSLPRVQYSGEMYTGRHQMRDSCMHRHPNDLRWSAQLAPPNAFCWDPYDSCPTSPRWFIEPEAYPWAHDVSSVSEDQRLRDLVIRRLYLREKRQAVKRHIQPCAGGAPFITCYFCLKVLQLPEHFLHSRRTIIRRLKCGACSSILEFSLENGCLAPRIPDDTAEATETNARRNDSAEIGSRNSRSEERTGGSHRAGGHPVQGRQMRVTWQLPSRRSKSPLHRLMGYSSPQDIYNEHEGEDVDW